MISMMPMMFLLFFFGLSSTPVAQTPADPVKSRANYEAVVSHLDTGGDLMVVANIDGIIENTVAGLRGLVEMMPRSMDPETKQVFDRLPAYITGSGLYAVDGFGMSLVPRGDGLNQLKVFVRRDPAAANLPLWRAMVGGAPRALASLDYLPADTVLARTGSGEPAQLWKMVTDAVRQVGGPAASQKFDQSLAMAGGFLGTNIETVVSSLGADAFFALELSTTQTLPIPMPDAGDQTEPLTIPRPGLIVGAAVRDATLPMTLQRVLDRNQVPCVTSQVAGVTLFSITVPNAEPYPFNPTFALHKGMFLFGSTPDVVKAAMSAADNKTGLRGTPAFQKAFAGLPLENNGISIMDPRFSQTLSQVQARLLRSAAGGKDSVLPEKNLFSQGMGSHLLVIVNEKDGISIRGTTSASACQTLMSGTFLPMSAALGSAIAIPSFMRARSTATRYSCINNLRILDSAKDQWALEFNKQEGAAVVEKEVLQYIKGSRMPICPQGGRYTLGVIGQPPTCSHPGHKLQ